MAKAAVLHSQYDTAPVSPLYLFDRQQDVALQKARSSVSRRNHLRLWLAPFTVEHRAVWIGQISRDIGVKLTTKSWYLTTHRISPYVDEERDYLLQDLLLTGLVERLGYVDGVGVATPEQPRRNLTDDPYYTDGRRMSCSSARSFVRRSRLACSAGRHRRQPVGRDRVSSARLKSRCGSPRRCLGRAPRCWWRFTLRPRSPCRCPAFASGGRRRSARAGIGSTGDARRGALRRWVRIAARAVRYTGRKVGDWPCRSPYSIRGSRTDANAGHGDVRRPARLHGAGRAAAPAGLVPLLDEFFGVLTDCAGRGGEVYHLAGDGMMAGFGTGHGARGAAEALRRGASMLDGFEPSPRAGAAKWPWRPASASASTWARSPSRASGRRASRRRRCSARPSTSPRACAAARAPERSCSPRRSRPPSRPGAERGDGLRLPEATALPGPWPRGAARHLVPAGPRAPRALRARRRSGRASYGGHRRGWRCRVDFPTPEPGAMSARPPPPGNRDARPTGPPRAGTQLWWGPAASHPLARVGPGLITGVADDDPSGIATYSQAGAQFGLNMLWTMPLAFPLMAACSRCARASAGSPAGAGREHQAAFPPAVLWRGCAAADRQHTEHSRRRRGDGRGWRTRHGIGRHLMTAVFVIVTCCCRFRPLSPLRDCPEVADAVAARLRPRAVHGARAVGGSRAAHLWPSSHSRRRGRGRGRPVRHHDQPVSLLLAGVRGGRGPDARTGGERCSNGARPASCGGSAGTRGAAWYRMSPRISSSWPPRSRSTWPASPTSKRRHRRRARCARSRAISPIEVFALGNNRRRTDRRAGAGGLRRLCTRRSVRLALWPGAPAWRGARLLRHDQRQRAGWHF